VPPSPSPTGAMAPNLQRLRSCAGLTFFLAVCGGVFALNGVITALSVENWYPGLIKPPGTPPDWVFPLVWGAIFVLMALGGWHAWRSCGPGSCGPAMTRFACQLGLNLGWTALFFGLRSPTLALLELPLLLAAIGVTITTFWRIAPLAALALVPYLFWVSYAAYLNAGILLLNRLSGFPGHGASLVTGLGLV